MGNKTYTEGGYNFNPAMYEIIRNNSISNDESGFRTLVSDVVATVLALQFRNGLARVRLEEIAQRFLAPRLIGNTHATQIIRCSLLFRPVERVLSIFHRSNLT